MDDIMGRTKFRFAVASAFLILYANTVFAEDAEGKVYIDNNTGSSINFILKNLASQHSNALPTNAIISESASGDYVEYSVPEEYLECDENNLEIMFCAYGTATYSNKIIPNCKLSRDTCGTGDITTVCYFGTSNVNYCDGELVCVDASNCGLGDLPGGFSFNQGDSGTNKLTFKISR